jgi:hypothetical protein
MDRREIEDIAMSTAEMKATSLLETHGKTTHHGSPPCQPFLDFKTDQRWVMGIVGALILGGAAIFWTFMKESQTDRADLRMMFVRSSANNEMQFKYLVEGMARLQLSMEQLQANSIRVSGKSTTP